MTKTKNLSQKNSFGEGKKMRNEIPNNIEANTPANDMSR